MIMEQHKVLIVDDEEDISTMLAYNLKSEGFEVKTAINGKEAIEVAQIFIPDLILMDVMMPVMDGIEACEEIRKIDALKSTVIAFLTARSEDYSQIAGFESGADDYITKPVKPKVLMSRVKALLRRPTNVQEFEDNNNEGIVHGIRINKEEHLVYIGDDSLSLPRKEFKLLELLISKPGKVFTREHIMNEVWGDDVVVGDRTIDVHIRKLREKLDVDVIKTIKGVGYKIEAE